MWIEQPPAIFRRLFPGALFRIPPSGSPSPSVCLTFDDGPIPEVTPWVLDVLDRYDVKATFFMVGENVSRYPELLKEVCQRGHDLGNHTFHHVKAWKMSKKDYLSEIKQGKDITGSDLFRPPHGFLLPAQFKAIKKACTVVMHDVVTRDYDPSLSHSRVVDIVKKYVRDGSIIVFHDSLKSFPRLKKALPMSIQWLKDNGYEFGLIR